MLLDKHHLCGHTLFYELSHQAGWLLKCCCLNLQSEGDEKAWSPSRQNFIEGQSHLPKVMTDLPLQSLLMMRGLLINGGNMMLFCISYTLFRNQESLQACPQASLMKVIAQQRFPPLRYVWMNHYIHVHSILQTQHDKSIRDQYIIMCLTTSQSGPGR